MNNFIKDFPTDTVTRDIIQALELSAKCGGEKLTLYDLIHTPTGKLYVYPLCNQDYWGKPKCERCPLKGLNDCRRNLLTNNEYDMPYVESVIRRCQLFYKREMTS